MNKKIFLFLPIIVASSMSIAACGNKETNLKETVATDSTNVDKYIYDLKPLAKGQAYIPMPDCSYIAKYDMNSKTYLGECFDNLPEGVDHDLLYVCPQFKGYYTATTWYGTDSDTSIFTVDNGKINIQYKNKGNEGIFPLAQTDKYLVFSIEHDGPGSSTIVLFDKKNKTLKPYKKTACKDNIEYGAIIKNTLYFSTYVESENKFYLKKIDLRDFNAIPETIKEMSEGYIFTYNDSLMLCDGDNMKSDKYTFPRGPRNRDNIFWNDYLITFLVDKNGDRLANILNCKTGKLVDKISNPLGFYNFSDDKTLTLVSRDNIFKYNKNRRI